MGFQILRNLETETDALQNNKTNAADAYTQVESNNLLGNKLDMATYNTGIALKADLSNVIQSLRAFRRP